MYDSMDSVLPLDIQRYIIDISNRMVHEEKQDRMLEELKTQFSFPTIWERCNCEDCYKVFTTTIPLFMQLKFIGDVYDNSKIKKSSSFETIFRDYETFYTCYIPTYNLDEDSEEDSEETEILIRHFTNFTYS